MDYELFEIQIVQDLSELAEQYDGAADNELLWSLGAPDAESAKLHAQNVVQNREMAKMYRNMAKYPRALFKLFAED
jgi:hypothetical protein